MQIVPCNIQQGCAVITVRLSVYTKSLLNNCYIKTSKRKHVSKKVKNYNVTHNELTHYAALWDTNKTTIFKLANGECCATKHTMSFMGYKQTTITM